MAKYWITFTFQDQTRKVFEWIAYVLTWILLTDKYSTLISRNCALFLYLESMFMPVLFVGNIFKVRLLDAQIKYVSILNDVFQILLHLWKCFNNLKTNAILIIFISGRGNNTHAYTHSVSESHHVFLNLHTLKFYCLPDNYEIIGKTSGFLFECIFYIALCNSIITAIFIF